MNFLQKLLVPNWKHADPIVRMASLYDLDPDDGDVLQILARTDPEARVRRVAVARVQDADLLGEVASNDPDDEVRSEALRGLGGLAVEAEDPTYAIAVVKHLLSLGRTKEVVAAVRDNVHMEVREAIVGLISDAKALGSISRHARDGATRLRALASLSDPTELLNVAVKSDHTDAAVSALEKIQGVEALTDVAQHARSKVAARRARAKLLALQKSNIESPEVAVEPMTPVVRSRVVELQAQADQLVIVGDPSEATNALAAVRLAWAEFQAEVVEIPLTEIKRFESASDAVREAILAREQEQEFERQRSEASSREQSERRAICEEIESLLGDGAEERIAELKVAWDNLDSMPSEYSASLSRRFQDVCRSFGERERRRKLAAAAAGRLSTLTHELEGLATASQPLQELIARWRGLRRDADVLIELTSDNTEAVRRLTRVVATLEEKEREYEEERSRIEVHNLKRLHQLCNHVETLADGDQLTLKSGERALHEIKQGLDGRVALPSKGDLQEIRKRLESARNVLGPRVRELRETDEWERWANVQVQETLCREMETLREEPSLEVAARRMKELQARWKSVALAPRSQGNVMWRRFKTAQEEVFSKTSSYFAQQREARAANLAKKDALCAQAEALSNSTDWVKTAAALKRCQAEWKAIGPVPKGREKAVWERFRVSCACFFSRRQENFKNRKAEWAGNLAKKVELCERVTALADSKEWESAASKLKGLQAEWKTIGPVRRSKSEATWQRFRTECDRFFERYKNRHQIDLEGRVQVREAVIRDLEALLSPGQAVTGSVPDNLYQLVNEARGRWQQAPELPRNLGQNLAARYHDAIGQLLSTWPASFVDTDLDPDVTLRRMEKLIGRVEAIRSAEPKATVESLSTELFAKQLRERLAANTMSGAAKSAELEESRRRALEQEVRSVQAQWARLGPVPPDVAAPLHERFQKACRGFEDRRRRTS